jgi:hypothetical protein
MGRQRVPPMVRTCDRSGGTAWRMPVAVRFQRVAWRRIKMPVRIHPRAEERAAEEREDRHDRRHHFEHAEHDGSDHRSDASATFRYRSREAFDRDHGDDAREVPS